MTVLFLSELLLFIRTETTSHMTIADFHEQDTVSIRLHVTFPHVECPGESCIYTLGTRVLVMSEFEVSAPSIAAPCQLADAPMRS